MTLTHGNASDPSRAPIPGEAGRALVADDDREMRAMIATVLRGDGFTVSEARNGAELLEIVRAAAAEDGVVPDLIVSDVRMPGKTGLAALAEVRALLHSTAVVVITAFADDAVRAEAALLGAVGVLAKPFDLDDLRTVVMNTTARRTAR